MQRLREFLTLILIGLLPFHALLVTVGTKLILGPGHAPWGFLAVWKEALLGVILLLVFLEIILRAWQRPAGSDQRAEGGHGPTPDARRPTPFVLDLIDILIIALFTIAILVSTINYQLSTINYPLHTTHYSLFLLGFKYDLLPLLAFLILRRVRWSEEFQSRVVRVLQIVGGVIAAYGIVSFFLPQSFFTLLGYSDLHSLYVPGGPLAAFQQIGGTAIRRIQSTMSGPNQLGLWLLIPWSILIVKLTLRQRSAISDQRSALSISSSILYFITTLIGSALFLTFSRSAWIAAFVILVVAFWMHLPRKKFYLTAAGLLGCVVAISFIGILVAPSIVLRTFSTRDHLARPLEALRVIAAHPLGLGLGTAGPASNRVSDPCVFLDPGADTSWAKDRPDLCVFQGEAQAQPTNRACNCPRIPENWYLQIGIEMGFIGMILFVALTILIIRKLSTTRPNGQAGRVNYQLSTFELLTTHPSDRIRAGYSLLTFLGISLAALFLHAWEDSAVTYTTWLMLAISQETFSIFLKYDE